MLLGEALEAPDFETSPVVGSLASLASDDYGCPLQEWWALRLFWAQRPAGHGQGLSSTYMFIRSDGGRGE